MRASHQIVLAAVAGCLAGFALGGVFIVAACVTAGVLDVNVIVPPLVMCLVPRISANWRQQVWDDRMAPYTADLQEFLKTFWEAPMPVQHEAIAEDLTREWFRHAA